MQLWKQKRLAMARPRAEHPDVAELAALIDQAGNLAVKVTPGARVEAITIEEGRLLVKVRARALDGQANAAVVSAVAGALGVPKSRVSVLRGATSREKVLRIDGWGE